jgi:hypothetical protein
MDTRPEGIYCHWEPLEVQFGFRRLIIERVNGDGTVHTFSCTDREATHISTFLDEPAQ